MHSVTHLLDQDFVRGRVPRFDAIEHLLVYDHCVTGSTSAAAGWTARRPRASAPSSTALPVSRPRRSSLGRVDRHPLRRRLERDRAQRRGLSHCAPRMPVLDPRKGTIRGSLLLGSDFVELERTARPSASTSSARGMSTASRARWPELMSAVAEGREPYNSGRHNLLSLEADARGGPLGRGRRPAGQADVTKRIAAGDLLGRQVLEGQPQVGTAFPQEREVGRLREDASAQTVGCRHSAPSGPTSLTWARTNRCSNRSRNAAVTRSWAGRRCRETKLYGRRTSPRCGEETVEELDHLGGRPQHALHRAFERQDRARTFGDREQPLDCVQKQ